MMSHLQYAGKFEGRYQVKVLGQYELENSTSNLLKTKIGDAHFGVFRHGKEALRLEVRGHDLSDMLITKEIYSEGRDELLFEEAWNAATELQEDTFRQIITHFAEELGQPLPQNLFSEGAPSAPGL